MPTINVYAYVYDMGWYGYVHGRGGTASHPKVIALTRNRPQFAVLGPAPIAPPAVMILKSWRAMKGSWFKALCIYAAAGPDRVRINILLVGMFTHFLDVWLWHIPVLILDCITFQWLIETLETWWEPSGWTSFTALGLPWIRRVCYAMSNGAAVLLGSNVNPGGLFVVRPTWGTILCGSASHRIPCNPMEHRGFGDAVYFQGLRFICIKDVMWVPKCRVFTDEIRSLGSLTIISDEALTV